VDIGDALVDALLVEVGHDDRHLQAAHEQQHHWLAIRPAPTMPTLVTLRASDLSGAPAGRLARFCTRSKA
jgi:hypothetical protein